MHCFGSLPNSSNKQLNRKLLKHGVMILLNIFQGLEGTSSMQMRTFQLIVKYITNFYMQIYMYYNLGIIIVIPQGVSGMTPCKFFRHPYIYISLISVSFVFVFTTFLIYPFQPNHKTLVWQDSHSHKTFWRQIGKDN